MPVISKLHEKPLLLLVNNIKGTIRTEIDAIQLYLHRDGFPFTFSLKTYIYAHNVVINTCKVVETS